MQPLWLEIVELEVPGIESPAPLCVLTLLDGRCGLSEQKAMWDDVNPRPGSSLLLYIMILPCSGLFFTFEGVVL